MCTLEDYKHLVLTEYHRVLLEAELEMWHRFYPPVGSTVLDIGAGCGETALFYLLHGARRVVCIEGDTEAVKLLKQNFRNDQRVTIVDAFIDSIKMDVEGSEINAKIETHFPVSFKRMARLSTRNVSLWSIEERDRSVADHLYWTLKEFPHRLKIRMAHTIRLILDNLSNKRRE